MYKMAKGAKVFLVGDHNRPGGVWAVDIDLWDWMIYNGCMPYVLSQEEAQKLLMEGGMGVDFGEEDNRWNFHHYVPMTEGCRKELRLDHETEWEYWELTHQTLLNSLAEKGW
jgi:hypothetical protein